MEVFETLFIIDWALTDDWTDPICSSWNKKNPTGPVRWSSGPLGPSVPGTLRGRRAEGVRALLYCSCTVVAASGCRMETAYVRHRQKLIRDRHFSKKELFQVQQLLNYLYSFSKQREQVSQPDRDTGNQETGRKLFRSGN